MIPAAAPALHVVTTPLAEPLDTESLLQRASPSNPLVWLRRGRGLAGHGEVLRLTASGPTRFADLSDAWRHVAAAAIVDDAVGVPGSGLIAFGSFAFAESSSAGSELVVPARVFGTDGARSWVTTITVSGGSPEPENVTALGPSALGVAFSPAELGVDAYRSAVDAALERIDSDEVEKVVLARELRATLQPGGDLRAPLLALADGYPDCWTFAVDGLLGSSPEMLVRVEAATVQARVLAGSRARGTGAAADRQSALELATSEKDRDEHGFAVRSVLGSLAPHTSALAASEMPFTLKLPNLWHLASDVEGRLADGSSSLDLVAAMHPTAAVAGTPTPEALGLIAELEPFDRRRYAAPVGWIDASGDGEWAIALRCAEVIGTTVTAYAGAGIVAGSVAERELAETGMKFRPVLDAFS